VTKEKQVLGLVEKLLGRLRTPGSGDAAERGWQDTAFCLAKLPLPERSLKLLRENAGAYLDKLEDDEIYDAFIDVVENLRRIDKPEFTVSWLKAKRRSASRERETANVLSNK
jgi:condensin complex subunit 1